MLAAGGCVISRGASGPVRGRGDVDDDAARARRGRRLAEGTLRTFTKRWVAVAAILVAAAVEDSQNGIRSAKAAGMHVFAIPNPHFPPDAAALADADVVLASIAELPAALD